MATERASANCGMKCPAVIRLMFAAFCSWSSMKISERRSMLMVFPNFEFAKSAFWQKIHRRLQPQKKTAPEPWEPLIQGSSQ